MTQARLLWSDLQLRGQFRPLVSTPDGVGLVWNTFAHQPDEMSEINRWLALRRRALSN